MRSANALLYLSPQQDQRRYYMTSVPPINEDEEDEGFSFRNGQYSANFADDVSGHHSNFLTSNMDYNSRLLPAQRFEPYL